MEQLLNLMPWMWGVILLSTVIVKLFLSDTDAIWFSIGAGMALLLSLFRVHIVIQLSSFIIITVILLFTVGRWIKKSIMTKNISLNSDSLIGKEILILESVNEFDNGSGVIDDIVWTVVCQAGVSIEKGKHAIIVAIDENKLVVTNKNN